MGLLTAPTGDRKARGNARDSGYEKAADAWYVESEACVDALLRAEPFHGLTWDPSAGAGNIPRRCAKADVQCIGSDLVDRGAGFPVIDFLGLMVPVQERAKGVHNILCNPPFSGAQEFVERALRLVPGKVCVLQRLAWLEGQQRRLFFRRTGLSHVWVHSSRISMPPGGLEIEAKGGAIAYAWFVWRRTPPGHPWTGDFLP